jgi:hypothetical protein
MQHLLASNTPGIQNASLEALLQNDGRSASFALFSAGKIVVKQPNFPAPF